MSSRTINHGLWAYLFQKDKNYVSLYWTETHKFTSNFTKSWSRRKEISLDNPCMEGGRGRVPMSAPYDTERTCHPPFCFTSKFWVTFLNNGKYLFHFTNHLLILGQKNGRGEPYFGGGSWATQGERSWAGRDSHLLTRSPKLIPRLHIAFPLFTSSSSRSCTCSWWHFSPLRLSLRLTWRHMLGGGWSPLPWASPGSPGLI